MMVVISYDIATSKGGGAKRLRRVAAECRDRGVPVQDSVYECEVNAEQYRVLKASLERLIDPDADSIRFYLLGNRYTGRIERIGRETVGWDREGCVI